MTTTQSVGRLVALALAAAAAGCATPPAVDGKPAWLTIVSARTLDGKSDDLLSAGMGLDPLIGKGDAPKYADPLRA